MKQVWVVQSGAYSDRGIDGIYASEQAALDGIKAEYGEPYRVKWDEPVRDDGVLTLRGHFEAVTGYSTAHTAHYDIDPWDVQGEA